MPGATVGFDLRVEAFSGNAKPKNMQPCQCQGDNRNHEFVCCHDDAFLVIANTQSENARDTSPPSAHQSVGSEYLVMSSVNGRKTAKPIIPMPSAFRKFAISFTRSFQIRIAS